MIEQLGPEGFYDRICYRKEIFTGGRKAAALGGKKNRKLRVERLGRDGSVNGRMKSFYQRGKKEEYGSLPELAGGLEILGQSASLCILNGDRGYVGEKNTRGLAKVSRAEKRMEKP